MWQGLRVGMGLGGRVSMVVGVGVLVGVRVRVAMGMRVWVRMWMRERMRVGMRMWVMVMALVANNCSIHVVRIPLRARMRVVVLTPHDRGSHGLRGAVQPRLGGRHEGACTVGPMVRLGEGVGGSWGVGVGVHGGAVVVLAGVCVGVLVWVLMRVRVGVWMRVLVGVWMRVGMGVGVGVGSVVGALVKVVEVAGRWWMVVVVTVVDMLVTHRVAELCHLTRWREWRR